MRILPADLQDCIDALEQEGITDLSSTERRKADEMREQCETYIRLYDETTGEYPGEVPDDLVTGEEAEKMFRELLSDQELWSEEHYNRRGLFREEGLGYWIAFDNTSGECWQDEFATETECIQWLNNR